jgi:agmatine deiminase
MRNTPPDNLFIMPAEWERHKATWLAWPYDPITFPDRVKKIEQLYALIISHLSVSEIVNLLVLDDAMEINVSALLLTQQVKLDNVIFHRADYADVWMRDYWPTLVISNQRTAWIKWRYNAYGHKFPDLLKDDLSFFQLKDTIESPIIEAGIFMEGGAIEVNGAGILLTTEECLLNPNRNYELDKKQTEEYLKKYLGVKDIIWLKKGLVNDHTDGHIDEIARFVDANTIVCAYEEDVNDLNFAILDENFEVLQNAVNPESEAFRIIKLPMPKVYYDNGERAPASYANFYIANQMVLVPTFEHENDTVALEIIQTLFPERAVIGINCIDLIYGGGTLHCITQQEMQT